jgi:hypothetical protein
MNSAAAETAVGRSYTRGRRQPYLVRKWPGSRWTLPLGPYTITQLLLLVTSAYLLVTYYDWWAHFGLFNLPIGVAVPAGLTYAARHSRIEGRDPLRAAVAWAGYLTQPRTGYLGGRPVTAPAPVRQPGGGFTVAELNPALLAAPTPAPAPTRTRRRRTTTPAPPVGASLADLLATASGGR